MTKEIKTATAEYTGGGIYVYHGQLQDGNHFRTCDDWETIEICDADTGVEDANYIEFYEEHRVEILVEDGYRRFWNQMIQWIIQNQPDGNYATNELENRLLEELVEIKTYENQYEVPTEKEEVILIGFIHKYGKNDYGLWNVELEEADAEAIQEILAKYETDGFSVTGKAEELSLMDLFDVE